MANSTYYSAAVATKEEHGDVFVFATAQAVIPQEPPQEYGSQGLTWEDNYYNDKEDIVAVFDVDDKTVSDIHYSIAIKRFPAVSLFIVLLSLFVGWLCVAFFESAYGVLGFVFLVLYGHIRCICFLSARRAKSAKIHMAVTSDCILYDQESPDVHVMVS
jgi:hypothetical protein